MKSGIFAMFLALAFLAAGSAPALANPDPIKELGKDICKGEH